MPTLTAPYDTNHDEGPDDECNQNDRPDHITQIPHIGGTNLGKKEQVTQKESVAE